MQYPNMMHCKHFQFAQMAIWDETATNRVKDYFTVTCAAIHASVLKVIVIIYMDAEEVIF